MPADHRLSRLVRDGAAVDNVLRAVTRHLATWHAKAPRSRDVDEQGTRDALSSRWEAGFAQVRALADDGFVPDGVAEVERLVRRYLVGRERLFESRIEQGRVIDGHGDLLAEDVFCLDDGPRVLDCLESGAEAASRRLVSTTLRHLRTSAVCLTLVGGLPGSGKSTLAGALADRLGVTLLSSDRLRKELSGIPPEQSAAAGYGEGLYTPEWTARTYATLLDRAAALLSSGESVVLDATWSDAARREAALRLAEHTSADLVALHCHVPDDVAAAHLSRRAPGPSDAGLDVATGMTAKEPPWPEAVAVDTGGPLESAVSQALASVRPWGIRQAPVHRRPSMEAD